MGNVSKLPVLEVLSGTHFVADVTLGLGEVVHDYLADRQAASSQPFPRGGARAMNKMRPPRAKARGDNIEAIARRYGRIALVLQGGGALGAYQIGVYQALAEAGCEPKNHFRTANRAHFA